MDLDTLGYALAVLATVYLWGLLVFTVLAFLVLFIKDVIIRHGDAAKGSRVRDDHVDRT